MTSTRPTWAEISRSRLIHNHGVLRRLAGAETELLCVVKANAYGHGLVECARTLAGNGARWFGVTCVEEGVALRRELPEAGILVMSGIWSGEAEAVLEHDLTPVVWEARHLALLEGAAKRLRAAPGDCPVHLEIDTGMSRQGVRPEGVESLLGRFGKSSPLRLQAVMTHFHSPGNAELTAGQMREFVTAVGTIQGQDLWPEILSAGSSAAALEPDPELARTAKRMGAQPMVRAGIGLYGYAPDAEHPSEGAGQLEPVLQWKTRVVSLREIPPGATVGYDATFTAQRPMKLALLPVGYADGVNRLLSNRGEVLVRGKKAGVVGRVSMDHTSVDVTDVAGVEVGDEVVLIGAQSTEQGEVKVTAADVAKLTGTIPYEVLCGIAARVPRTVVD
jgi:alanine racemase